MKTTALEITALKIYSEENISASKKTGTKKYSYITYKFRFFVNFYLVLPALATFSLNMQLK